MGMRLRMKGSYFKDHLGDFPPGSQSRPIFEAFRHYGVINADNGSNWFFQGSVDDALGRRRPGPPEGHPRQRLPGREERGEGRVPC